MCIVLKLAENRKLLISAVTGVGGVCLYLLARGSYAYRYYIKCKSALTAIITLRSDQDMVLSSKVL